ncbi:MAG: phage protein GemA/Gp16 family protein [bacterium]
MVTKQQIKIIHTLKSRLGWDDEMYYSVLEKYGVKTSTALSDGKAAQLIDEMNRAAGNTKYKRLKYAGLKRDREMASPAQLRAIEAMWADVSKMKNERERAVALRKFIRRIVKVEEIQWLEKWMVKKIIKALVSMGADDPETYDREVQHG